MSVFWSVDAILRCRVIPLWSSFLTNVYLTGTNEWKPRSSGPERDIASPEWEPTGPDVFTGKWVNVALIHIVVICCIAVSVRRLMRCCFSFRLPMSPILRRYRSCKTFLFTFCRCSECIWNDMIPSLWTLPTLPLFSPVCLRRSCRERAWRILWTLKGAVEPVEKLTCR